MNGQYPHRGWLEVDSILFRIALLCALAVSLALILFALFVIPYQRQLLEEQLESTAEVIATSIEQVTTNSIMLEDYSTVIDHCLKVVRERPLVLYLVITRPNGDSFIHIGQQWSYRQLGGAWQPTETPTARFENSELAGQSVYHYTHAFRYASIDGGWIHVGLSTANFNADVRAIYVRTILLALLCLMAVLAIALFFARRLSLPIRQLDVLAQQVAEGDLNARAELEGASEIVHLARSFNQMTEALTHARNELEQRVNERTAELRTTNIQLQQEIEERHQTERELVRLERLRAIGEMSAGVSHNLNNLLVGIIGPTEILREQPLDTDTRELLDIIAGAADRAADLVQRLHQAVHIEHDFELRPILLNDAVREAVQSTRPRWKDESEARGVRIEVTTELADVPLIDGAQNELHHTIVNLIFNAVDALPSDGQITLRTWCEEDQVLLSISDNGIGMDEETCRRIFEPFFTTKKDVGTGLGLSTVYGTINRWGGHIRVESKLGLGTYFVLSFVPCEVKEEIEPRQEQRIPPASGARLLVIDEEELVTKLLVRHLGTGNEVHTFTSGAEALASFAAGQYHIALVDLGLQDISGDQVARRLRQADPHIALVLISGWSLTESDPRRTVFDLYLGKPFARLYQIDEVVHQAFALHRERASI
ncbi:MAG: signal transduction histidine kinase [Candidatus Latescibacterota bacterium]